MVTPPCSSCGNPTEPGARFCGVCGQRLEERPPPPLDATIPDLHALDASFATIQTPTLPPAELSPSHAAVLGSSAPFSGTVPLPTLPPTVLAAAMADARPRGTPITTPAIERPRMPSPVPGVSAPTAFDVRARIPSPVLGGAPDRPRVPSPAPGVPAGGAGSPRGSNSRLQLQSLDRLIGRTLNNRYQVERKIGEGGFGAVFRGRQVATGREVALKILHPHNVNDATVVARFRREAEACSKLTNPHTVVIYDFDETEDGILYLAMELLRGRPLQDVERSEGPLEPRRVLSILAQAAEALGEAHGKGIVHRDMKPENLMIEEREGEDFVKVLDFGIAKLGEGAGKPVPALTAVGQTLGTLEFMSPEQLRGKPLDGRSDLYALGIMAYEMLTGLLPWREARVPIDVIKFHLETAAQPPSTLRRDLVIPREVDEVVTKMVAKEPADRHADAAELRVHIESALGALERRRTRARGLKLMGIATGVAAVLAATAIALLR